MRLSYGLWQSVLPASLVATASTKIEEVHLDGSTLYWIESRPDEQGRRVIMRRLQGGRQDEVTPAPFSAGSQVHSYGGAAMVVDSGVIYFSNLKDGRVYRVLPGQQPQPVTAAKAVRYADLVIDASRGRLIAVREDHRFSKQEAINELVAINLKTGRVNVLQDGADFYAAPRLSPDGQELAWIQWQHPRMPWDGTKLCQARVTVAGRLTKCRVLIDGERRSPESIIQPVWSLDGRLHFSSDRTGWWNIYQYRDGEAKPVVVRDGDIGAPLWYLGQASYEFGPGQMLICATRGDNRYRLSATNQVADMDLDWLPTEAIEVQEVRCSDCRIAVLASGPDLPSSIFLFDANGKLVERIGSDLPVAKETISRPQAITFPTTEGDSAHGFFYPPHNPAVTTRESEKPPLIVVAHGGPTASTSRRFRPDIQFWTSRGFAVLDVDYRGSSGYGRSYRERLTGQWGVYDVADCVAGVQYLATQGKIDPERVAIRGGSAGGFTVLCALVFHRTFRAGVSYYGISDLSTLSGDTHKFESRYLDSLVPRTLWAQRSPINAIDQLDCPMILFQGLLDEAVPPVQAQKMVDVLRAKGLACEYVTFANEGHGFRQAENIATALEAELAFFQKIFQIK